MSRRHISPLIPRSLPLSLVQCDGSTDQNGAQASERASERRRGTEIALFHSSRSTSPFVGRGTELKRGRTDEGTEGISATICTEGHRKDHQAQLGRPTERGGMIQVARSHVRVEVWIMQRGHVCELLRTWMQRSCNLSQSHSKTREGGETVTCERCGCGLVVHSRFSLNR